MFFRKHFLTVALLSAVLLQAGSPSIVAGAGYDNGVLGGVSACDFQTGKLTAACIPIFIAHLIQFVGILFVLNVMYAGYQLAIAYIGESDKGAGKDRLKWSIAGLVICTCSYLILDLVLNVVLG
jgi:hypothetical protein